MPGSDETHAESREVAVTAARAAAAKQATDVTDGWVARSVNDGTRDGSVTVGARTFERFVAQSGTQISYVERAAGSDPTTLVVTTTAAEDELKAFVAALHEVTPAP